MVENNAYILHISEIKLDDSFSSGQFKICQFSMPYRYDRNAMGGGLLLYIRDNIPTKLLRHDFGTMEIFQLKLIYEKENDFSMTLTIRIKVKF